MSSATVDEVTKEVSEVKLEPNDTIAGVNNNQTIAATANSIKRKRSVKKKLSDEEILEALRKSHIYSINYAEKLIILGKR